MRRALHSFAPVVLAVALAGMATGAGAADYSLTSPALLLEQEGGSHVPLAAIGAVPLAAARSPTGLSLQAGQQWFARFELGRSLDSGMVSVGGGYRFDDGQALSMHVARQLGTERLGLAVRYDFSRAWLRLGYEAPLHRPAGTDILRFSAGVRF